jgi:hypothetical protein
MIQADVIRDSVSAEGHRLTTFKLRYPKFIHGELMTHRRFSRNASSSRAIPVAKSIEETRSSALRAGPVHWGVEQKGMLSGTMLASKEAQDAAGVWELAALHAANAAEELARIGVHKSIANRVMEPYLHINVVVSATEYMNFFGLRLDRAAQPEMRVLAERMWAAYSESVPRPMKAEDNWHLPFFDPQDWDALRDSVAFEKLDEPGDIPGSHCYAKDLAIKISVARCARVSYENFDTGKRSSVQADLQLYDRLMGAQPLHASPAEHQATPDRLLHTGAWSRPGWHGNFTGWRQYRKMVTGEDMAPLPAEYLD